jgi:hypothetical protein
MSRRSRVVVETMPERSNRMPGALGHRGGQLGQDLSRH